MRKPKPKARGPRDVAAEGALALEFVDNRLLARLIGPHDAHLARIEAATGVRLNRKGNRIAVDGPRAARELAVGVLEDLYSQLTRGADLGMPDVEAALRIAEARAAGAIEGVGADLNFRTPRRLIAPRSAVQAAYAAALKHHEITFGLGPAGTGKTYMAVAAAVQALVQGQVDRLVLCRPAVEAGERIGFLPGDIKEKLDPYLRPLYDALQDMMPADALNRRMEEREIEIAPLAFMRGRTLSHAFIILDEAQNCTPMQMKMALTRLGEGSRMAITGDPSQTDLPKDQPSGLDEAVDVLADVEEIAFVRFSEADVVRHPLVSRVVRAYNAFETRPDGARVPLPPVPPRFRRGSEPEA